MKVISVSSAASLAVLLAASFATASANPVKPGQGQGQVGPSALSYDLDRAIVAGSRNAGLGSDSLQGEIILNGEGGLTIIVPDFGISLDSADDALTARSNARAAIPVDALDGFRPEFLVARAGYSVRKGRSSSTSVSLKAALYGEPTEPTSILDRRGSSARRRGFIESIALISDQRACLGGGRGVLTVDFAAALERDNALSEASITPIDGRSLIVDVLVGEAMSCRNERR